ncbi:MAG: P1 family peptidase, partial [Solirubrobacterales bacterium]|nr:P1 family peptidase [Solirubrobacterales bacterium]
MRARDHGIVIGDGTPGPSNAITDVAGVRVGHRTLIEGSGPLVVGRGPVRTGVTVILPPGNVWEAPVFAGPHRLNGNGEMTGLEWVRESGMLTTPVALTNTHSVGVVRDALLAEVLEADPARGSEWSLPVVAETWDGMLNDLNGFHVRPEHVHDAFAAAAAGAVAEGAVGAGTGMIAHGFKGGIGTASRVRLESEGGHTVGVLVLANHGQRRRFAVNGVLVGHVLDEIPLPGAPD